MRMGVLFALLLLTGCAPAPEADDFDAPAKAAPSAADVTSQAVAAQAAAEAQRLQDLWDYQRVPVPGGEQVTAALYSHVDSDPEAETMPVPDARLVLRRHPAWGRSAYLLLNQQQLRCAPPCLLSLRFDDGETLSFRGKPADSGSGPALFIAPEARFRDRLRGAKRLRVQLPQSGALVPVFVFEVAGYRPERLEQ